MRPIAFSYRCASISLFSSSFFRNCKLQPLKGHVTSWGGFTALQHTARLDVRACHLADSDLLNFDVEVYQNAYVLKRCACASSQGKRSSCRYGASNTCFSPLALNIFNKQWYHFLNKICLLRYYVIINYFTRNSSVNFEKLFLFCRLGSFFISWNCGS